MRERRSRRGSRISSRRRVSNDPDWDVVVVGSGAGGSAATWRLCRRGLRVLLLEAGPRFNPATDYPLDRSDWETRGVPEQPGSQGRYTYALSQPLIGEESTLRSRNRVAGNINRQRTRQIIGYEHVRG